MSLPGVEADNQDEAQVDLVDRKPIEHEKSLMGLCPKPRTRREAAGQASKPRLPSSQERLSLRTVKAFRGINGFHPAERVPAIYSTVP